MQLPVKLIAMILVVLLVLFTLVTFVFSQSGEQFTQADALRVFNAACSQYQNQRCDWSVTKEDGFADFLAACKHLYGDEREAYSCLYALCQACREFDVGELRCEGLCNICEGNAKLGIDNTACCTQYANECSVACNICG